MFGDTLRKRISNCLPRRGHFFGAQSPKKRSTLSVKSLFSLAPPVICLANQAGVVQEFFTAKDTKYTKVLAVFVLFSNIITQGYLLTS